MAYEMIVGRPPFEAETPLAVVLKHVTEPLTPPSVMNPRVPIAVSDVIVKSLHKNPDDRYLTTGEFAEALSTAIYSAPVLGTAPLPIQFGQTVPVAEWRERVYQDTQTIIADIDAVIAGMPPIINKLRAISPFVKSTVP